MYCQKCGKDNLNGAQVCVGCGAELQGSAQPAQTPPISAPRTSPMAIWSLVLGILGWFTFLPIIPGIILGILGLKQVKEKPREYTGSGLATAGIVVSAAGVLVFAVTAMLAAILFPVFARARESARKANCVSNIKQIGLSLRIYQDDWDECYPPVAKWTDVLKPYTGNMGAGDMIFGCPAKPSLDCGYGLNAILGGQPLSAITSPAETIAVFESDRGWNAFGGSEALVKKPRHSSGMVTGFADGHVACIDFRDQMSPDVPNFNWSLDAPSGSPRTRLP